MYRQCTAARRFFSKKLGYMPENDPGLPFVRPSFAAAVQELDDALDVNLAASGGWLVEVGRKVAGRWQAAGSRR